MRRFPLFLMSACYLTDAFSTPKLSVSRVVPVPAAMKTGDGDDDDAESTRTTENPTTTTTGTQEWDVNRYQDQHSFVWEYGTSLVDLLQAQPGERILDIGCGTGELTNAIACCCQGQAAAARDHDHNNNKNMIEVIGMDSDPSMVQRAQEQYPNLSFFQGDVRSFVLEDIGGEPVDAIFSNAALHWVPPNEADVDRSVRSMANVLKKNGRFVVEFGGKGNVQKIVEAVQDTMPGDVECPWYFPSISEYTTILERHGIEVLSATIFDRPTTLEDTEDGIKNWLRMFGSAFFTGKEEKDIDQALDTIQDKLRPHLHDGKKWIADYRRIRIVGRKIN